MPRVQTETRSRRRPSITGMPERRPGDRSIWGLFLVFGMAEAAIVPFLPLLLQDHGYSGSQIGLALAAMALAALLATPAWGHLGDVHLSLSRAFACAATATALCSLLLGVARGPAFVAALVALAACRLALTPLSDALALAQLASRRTRYGTVRMWLSAGFAAAAIGWGLVLAGRGSAPCRWCTRPPCWPRRRSLSCCARPRRHASGDGRCAMPWPGWRERQGCSRSYSPWCWSTHRSWQHRASSHCG
jgi:MFS family permease